MGRVCRGGKEGPSEVSFLAIECNAICKKGIENCTKIQESATGHEKHKHKKGEGALQATLQGHPATRHRASILLTPLLDAVTDIEDETNTAELGLGGSIGSFDGWVVCKTRGETKYAYTYKALEAVRMSYCIWADGYLDFEKKRGAQETRNQCIKTRLSWPLS